MHKEYHKFYSRFLDREMELNIYGQGGKACLVFPAQDGRFFDFENFGMVDVCSDYIDDDRLQLFCIDSIDKESWSDTYGDPRYRIEQHQKWYHYIIEEVIPFIIQKNTEANGYKVDGIITTGCSMGASHAANFYFRRPDIFDAVIALSGYYNSDLFFGRYMDDFVYINSPEHYIEGMDYHHPNVENYRSGTIILCCGQGDWEDDMIRSTSRIKELLDYKDVTNLIDFWGYDVNHDWPWWRKQLPYFLEKIV